MRRHSNGWLALACASIACTGIWRTGPDDEGSTRDRTQSSDGPLAATAIPRLSTREVDAVLADVFGIEGAAARNLPADATTAMNPRTGAIEEVFDSDLLTKTPSQVFVDGLETLAFDVALEWTRDTARVDALAGCTPSGASDEDCLRALIRTLALRLWRRPITSDEENTLAALSSPFAVEGGFYLAVRAVVQSLLESPAFVYRVEIGEDAGDGERRLDDHELLSRVSFFLWGSAPTPELYDAASGGLDEDVLAELARSMANDPRADEQMRVFHRMWLRYDRALVADVELATAMRAESDALLERALFGDQAHWNELFTATETYVTPALAEHYAFANVPEVSAWVAYEDAERAGLLTHGSLLSLSSTRVTETLPSRRGAMFARRLLCIPILPPPADVDIDDGVEVEPGSCKSDAYSAHRSNGTCRGCHDVIDGIGFGFERFDGVGRYRTTESENPSCEIEGTGRVEGEVFASPREFAELADSSGRFARCGVEQVVRFARRHVAASQDVELVDRLNETFRASGYDFRELMIAVVIDPAFRTRWEEAP